MADLFMRARSSCCYESEAKLSLWPAVNVAGVQGGANQVELRTSDPGVLGSAFLFNQEGCWLEVESFCQQCCGFSNL